MFITFEGSEGCGKTTQVAALAEALCKAGYPVLATREPGGTTIGDEIRSVLLDLRNTAMQARTEILLLQASRAQLVEEVIRPHLLQGEVVICDRYADSTLAYQGYGYRLDLDELRDLIRFATGGLKPDLTLLLDLDAEEGLSRRARAGNWNRLDGFDLDFYQRVRQGYLEMARQEPERWVLVDAARPAGYVQADIWRTVLERLQARRAGSAETG